MNCLLYDGYDNVVGGDSNVDFERTSRILGLLVKCQMPITHDSGMGSKSLTDSLIVSESITINAVVFQLSMVLLQHLPIQINANLTAIGMYSNDLDIADRVLSCADFAWQSYSEFA